MEKNDDDILIEHKYLRKVIDDCKFHVKDLLKTAGHLHKEEIFDHSIMMSIISYEELNKLAVFCDHQRNSKGVTRKTMTDLNNHKYKLTKIFDLEIQREKHISSVLNEGVSSTKLKHLKDLESLKEWFSILNLIKQMAMYYDFRENRSITIKKHFKQSKLCHFSIYFQEYVYSQFQMELLIHKFGNEHGVIIASNDVEDSDEWRAIKSYRARLNPPDFDKPYQKFWITLREIKQLGINMKKKNLTV